VKKNDPTSFVKQTFFALFFAAQLLLVATSTQAHQYQSINTQNSVVGGDLNKTVTTVQDGTNSLDRFQMTKCARFCQRTAFQSINRT
jgi:hypothetical protein